MLDRDYFRFLRRLVEANPQIGARKLRRTEASPTKFATSSGAPTVGSPNPTSNPVPGELPPRGAAGASCAGSADGGGSGIGSGSGRVASGGAAASDGAVSMSGVSGGGVLGGGAACGAEGPPRGVPASRSDDAERSALDTLNLALLFLFRVCSLTEY